MVRKLFLVVFVVSTFMFATPAYAWGLLAHHKIADDGRGCKDCPSVVGYYYRSGSLGPDLGWALSAELGWNLHGEYVQDAETFSATLLDNAIGDWEKSFAYGWIAHVHADRPAHGSWGPPIDGVYDIGYVNYKSVVELGIPHDEVEFDLDGVIYWQKRAWKRGSYSCPTSLIIDTYECVYGSTVDPNDINYGFFLVSLARDMELLYWGSFWGLLDYLFIKNSYADYNTPYGESVSLVSAHLKDPGIPLDCEGTNTVDSKPEIMASKDKTKEKKREFLIKHGKKAIAEGAIKVKKHYDPKKGVFTVEIKVVDKDKMDKVLKEMHDERMEKRGKKV